MKKLILLVIGAVVMSGCALTGGGFTTGQSGSGKANYGFDLTCQSTQAGNFIGGSWVYHDKSPNPPLTDVRVAGTVTPPSVPCEPSTTTGGPDLWILPYTSQGPCTGPNCTGLAELVVLDGGTGGPASAKNDKIGIALFGSGPTQPWYSNGPWTGGTGILDGAPTPQPIGGGNLTVTCTLPVPPFC